MILFLLTIVGVNWASAADIEAGKQRSQVCTACHGEAGISNNPLWPNIAGQKQEYAVLQLKAFREDKRYHDLMTPISKTLTDEDIENLAAYFASLKGSP